MSCPSALATPTVRYIFILLLKVKNWRYSIKNDRVCFEVDIDPSLKPNAKPCAWGMN